MHCRVGYNQSYTREKAYNHCKEVDDNEWMQYKPSSEETYVNNIRRKKLKGVNLSLVEIKRLCVLRRRL